MSFSFDVLCVHENSFLAFYFNKINSKIWYLSNCSSFGRLCSRVTDIGIEAVVRSCKNLRSLNISGCKVFVSPVWLIPEIIRAVFSLLQMLVSGAKDKLHPDFMTRPCSVQMDPLLSVGFDSNSLKKLYSLSIEVLILAHYVLWLWLSMNLVLQSVTDKSLRSIAKYAQKIQNLNLTRWVLSLVAGPNSLVFDLLYVT